MVGLRLEGSLLNKVKLTSIRSHTGESKCITRPNITRHDSQYEDHGCRLTLDIAEDCDSSTVVQ